MTRILKLRGIEFRIVFARDGAGYTFTVRRADLPLIIARGWSQGTTKDALAEAKHGVARYLAK
jgi:hypothetical protein